MNAKLIWKLVLFLLEHGIGDLEDLLGQGTDYAAQQVLDVETGVARARELGLIPYTWKGVRRAHKRIGRWVLQHGGSPDEATLRQMFDAPPNEADDEDE